MGVDEIYDLLKKYRENTCTPEERERIVRWYRQQDDEVEQLPEIPRKKLEQLWYSIERKMRGRERSLFFSYAAMLIIMFSVGGGIFYLAKEKRGNHPVETVHQDLLPAKGVVMLQLSDGRSIPLTGTAIIKERGGQVIENDSAKVLDYTGVREKEVEPVYNKITVPTGGEYLVLLSDGSRVRLNSCSSLRYPVVFTGENRTVELEGEAYFEVEKSVHPFFVKTSNVNVRVTGTTFNVSDYADDSRVTTTLVEGQVVVNKRDQEEIYVLEPGLTFKYKKDNGKIKIKAEDPELYVAWMRGKFKFENMRLEDIVCKLNRWYDCNVEYADDTLRDLRFSGAAEKDRPASYLLEMIETVTDVKFDVSGKKIRISHK